MNDNVARSISFEVDGQDRDSFSVTRFEGREQLSTPYRFDLDLIADDPNLKLRDMVGRKGLIRLQIAGGPGQRPIHGVITEFTYAGEAPDDRHRYSARLEPRLALLGRRVRNQLFAVSGSQSILDIITEQLKGGGNSDGLGIDVLGADDFQFHTTRDYPHRHHMVQYNESDLDFLHRTLEAHGIFYYFEQEKDREVVVLCDDNTGFAPWLYEEDERTPAVLPYLPGSGMGRSDQPAILNITARQRPALKSVRLSDYNYRIPHVPLNAQKTVDEQGIGLIERFGDHFQTPEYGDRLAEVRREAALAECLRYEARSTIAAFQAGHIYELGNHPRSEFNGRHIITSIVHHGERKMLGDGVEADGRSVEYRNSYTAIPAGTPFRPQRVTPVPRMHGVMHGFVDGNTEDGRADIDEHGRYKIRIPFDPVDRKAKEASRYIRMAQPYGGEGHGMHMPLIKGTEVLWTCIDGDLDRPIICGVVPNHKQKSVVTDRNRTSNVIRTVSGIEMNFNDGSGRRRRKGGRQDAGHQGAGNALPAQQQNEGLFPCPAGGDPRFMPAAPAATLDTRLDVPIRQVSVGTLPVQRQFEGQGKFEGQGHLADQRQLEDQRQFQGSGSDFDEGTEHSEKWATITVPDYESSEDAQDRKTSYLRLGAHDDEFETTSNLPHLSFITDRYSTELEEAGWFDYTDGARVNYTHGDLVNIVEDGEMTNKVIKSGETISSVEVKKEGDSYHETTYLSVDSTEYVYGDKAEFFLGSTSECKASFFTEVSVGMGLGASLGVSAEFKAALGVEVSKQLMFEFSEESEHYTGEHQLMAKDKIVLSVDKTATTLVQADMKAASLIVGGLAGIVGGVAGAAFNEGDRLGGALRWAGPAAAAALTGTALLTRAKATAAHALNRTAPTITMNANSITLSIGPNKQIKMGPTGITLSSSVGITLEGDTLVKGQLLVSKAMGIGYEDKIVPDKALLVAGDMTSDSGNITATTGKIEAKAGIVKSVNGSM